MSGRSLPTFLELVGPSRFLARSWSTVLLGLTLAVAALIGAETALGFVFDPRYRDFPFASLTMAVVPFAGLMAAQPAAGRCAADRRVRRLPVCSCCRPSYIGFNEGPENWQSLWTCAIYSAVRRSRCGGRGPCKAQNKQADRDARQGDVVEHDAETGRDQCRRSISTIDGRSRLQRRNDERGDAEHRILEQIGHHQPALAQGALQAGVAGERRRGEFDGQITQIDGVADGQEADDEKPLHLTGGELERIFSCGNHGSKRGAEQPGMRSR